MKNENGQEKSAILKGQTLVNNYNKNTIMVINGGSVDGNVITLASNNGDWVVANNADLALKPLTKYLILINVLENTIQNNGNYSLAVENVTNNSAFSSGFTIGEGKVGIISKILTTKEEFTSQQSQSDLRISNTASGHIKFQYMIIEFQDGMENWDIPYFEGMQSVKNSQTLVNIIDYDNISLENATDNGDGTYTLKHAQDVNTSYVIPKTTKKNLFKPNTKYLLAVNIIENNTGTVLGLSGINSPLPVTINTQKNFRDMLGWQFKTFTTNSDITVDDAGRPVYNHIYFGMWEEGGD